MWVVSFNVLWQIFTILLTNLWYTYVYLDHPAPNHLRSVRNENFKNQEQKLYLHLLAHLGKHGSISLFSSAQTEALNKPLVTRDSESLIIVEYRQRRAMLVTILIKNEFSTIST